MKKLVFFLSLLPFFSYSQGPVAFQATYGDSLLDQCYSIEIDPNNGGYIMTGYTLAHGTADISLIKIDEDGSLQWSKALGGVSGEFGHSVSPTSDGGYIIAGWGKSFGAGDDDIYLIKTNSTGDVTWTKTFGGFTIDRARCVKQTADGGYIIAGSSTPFGQGVNYMYMIKTDANGDSTWTNVYGLGGGDNAWWVEQTADGGYITCGNTNQGAGLLNALVVKLTANGDTTWCKSYGVSSTLSSAYCIREKPSGGYIVGGYTTAISGGFDGMGLELDANGNITWAKAYGGSDSDEFQNVIQSGPGYVFAGKSKSWSSAPASNNVYLVETMSNGDTICTKALGDANEDVGYAATAAVGFGYVVAGTSNSFTNFLQDIYVAKAAPGFTGCNESFTATSVNTIPLLVSNIGLNIDYSPTVFSTPIITDSVLFQSDDILCITVTGVEENAELVSDLNVYPNPNNGEFAIQFPEGIEEFRDISVANAKGQVVYTKAVLRKTDSITLDDVPNGIYIIHALSDNTLYRNTFTVIGN